MFTTLVPVTHVLCDTRENNLKAMCMSFFGVQLWNAFPENIMKTVLEAYIQLYV